MSRSFLRKEWTILAAILVGDVALGLAVLLLHKGIAGHPVIFLGGVAGVGLTAAHLAWAFSCGERAERRTIVLATTTNLCALGCLAVVGEAAIRLGAIPSSQGVSFAGVRLVPQDWRATAEWNREVIHRSPVNISYFVEDSLLGWTVGPSRASKDGLYFSSREGLRSITAGVALAERQNLPRVALVGDSYTFGLEVRYEESWGSQLEARLSTPVQVLNFGVDGYGVDQAYLRYHRDVRPWHPDMVILAFINHDLYRTMVVYPFISMPDWLIPFPKPRFDVVDGALKLVNVPLAGVNAYLSMGRIDELPFVDLTPGYDAESWEWKWYHRSYLARFLFGAFPRWAPPSSLATPDKIATINKEILLTFIREVQSEGAEPLLVYLPNRWDLEGRVDLAPKILLFDQLNKSHVAVHDLTGCLAQLPVEKLFFHDERHHYTPEGNTIVARCLLPIVEEKLSTRSASRPFDRRVLSP